jgi:hypothetical protein
MIPAVDTPDRYSPIHWTYEYEVYSLLSRSGSETPPKCNFIPRGTRPSDEELSAFIVAVGAAQVPVLVDEVIRLDAAAGVMLIPGGMADSIQSDDFHMTLARFEESTRHTIATLLAEKKLAAFVTLSNPLDINPAADDETHKPWPMIPMWMPLW